MSIWNYFDRCVADVTARARREHWSETSKAHWQGRSNVHYTVGDLIMVRRSLSTISGQARLTLKPVKAVADGLRRFWIYTCCIYKVCGTGYRQPLIPCFSSIGRPHDATSNPRPGRSLAVTQDHSPHFQPTRDAENRQQRPNRPSHPGSSLAVTQYHSPHFQPTHGAKNRSQNAKCRQHRLN